MSTQNNWWRCNKCQVLTFGSGLTPGACQAGGQHDHTGSDEYSLVHDDATALGQSNWQWCNRCEGLTFTGGAALGVCAALPAGQPHDHAGSGNYAIEQYAFGPPAAAWRACNKCQALAWWTGGPAGGPCPVSGQHDYTGSMYYFVTSQDRREPIDQAVSRHLLTEFGPCNTALQARATLQDACKALIAKGGGIIVIPDSVPADFIATNSIQDTATKAGVVIEDYRGGAMRLVVLPEGVNDIYSDLIGGLTLERDLANDVQGQGGGAALAISNRSRGGVNSINDVIQQDVTKGVDARFYVNSLRGLCPGNWFTVSDGVQPEVSGKIKALGLDGNSPYFVADALYDYPAQKTRFWNKNWFGALDIADTHNADDQSGSLSVTRTTYGSGDSFGVAMNLQYSGEFMSAGGDEGGVLYSGEVRHDVDLFWGEVESWDPDTQTLVYKDNSAATQKPENWWKIGTSRPIINMNPTRWIQSGKVIIPQNGFKYNNIPSTVIGNTDVQWDLSIIGKFITIDEPSEYWDPKSPNPDPDYIDKAWAYMLGKHIVRRWFRIGTLVPRADGLWDLGIETVWWGNYQGGKPILMNSDNYYTTKPKELRYIIAPGSWAIDVRNALGPRKYYLGATPQERSIRLAPVQNAADAFAPGDPIAQPAGPTPWGPTSYRTRQVNLFPPLMPSSGFVALNQGPTTMGTGFLVGGPAASLAELHAKRKDGLPVFGSGLSIMASSQHAIYIKGPVLYTALFLDQDDGNKKLIQWRSNTAGTSIYGDPVTGDFTIEASGNVDLSLKSTCRQGGLSATPVAAKNLRGIDVSVAGGVSSLSVTFATPEPDAKYALMIQCNWLTATAVQTKSSSGFTVVFDKAAAPSGSKLDWFLVR
jgi:hypothetical protein